MRPRFLAAAASALAVVLFATPSVGRADPTSTTPAGGTRGIGFYVVDQPTSAQREILGRSGAAITDAGGQAYVQATAAEAKTLRDGGITLQQRAHPVEALNATFATAQVSSTSNKAAAAEFPPGFEGYHTYDEMGTELRRIQSAFPQQAKLVSLGKSYEGRDILALKISDNAQKPSKKPESLMTCNVHAREHLTAEMCLYMANELTSKYASDARIKKILETLVIWIVPMQNPDGVVFDISGGKFQSWRKNRQPSGGGMGIDLNRNYDYGWGGPGASTDPDSETYRGTRAEEGVETRVIANFIRSRKTQLKTYLDMHTFSQLVMWPYGNTNKQIMGNPEYKVLSTLGKKMASSNRYTPQKSSELYLSSGGSIDWAFGKQRVWSYVFEMYPGSNADDGFYPPASVIARETQRNREAILMLYENTDCMWKVTGEQSRCAKKK